MAANAGRNISQDPSILMNKLFAVLFEDDEMLAVNKPSDLVCHPTKGDVYSSLISRVRLYLGEGSTPHLVNRLDRETSGVVVVAKSPFMAGKLAGLWERRMVEKQYVAIVHGHVRDDRGSVEAPLGRDETSHVAIKDCVRIIVEQGRVEIACDFCGTQYHFDPVDVGGLFTPRHTQAPGSSALN